MLASAGRGLVGEWEAGARATGKLSAILKATGYSANLTTGEMLKLAKGISISTGAGGTATKTMVGLLATFREIKGDQFKRAATLIADMDAALSAAGLEVGGMEASTIRLGKALNDPIRGMTALQRVGVMFNDQQRNQITELQRSGRLQKAQAIILDELANEFGGAAAAANAATGGLATMRNSIGALKKQIGDSIATSATFRDGVKAIESAANSLLASGAIELWAGRVKQRIEALAPVVGWFGGILGRLLDTTAMLGSVAGGIAGGMSLGDAFAAAPKAAEEARAQAAADLAQNRARMAEEAAARDRSERQQAAILQGKANAARIADLAAMGASPYVPKTGKSAGAGAIAVSIDADPEDVQEQLDSAVRGDSAPTVPIAIDASQAGADAASAVAKIQRQIDAMASEAQSRRKAAIEQETKARQDLAAAAEQQAAAERALADLAKRSEALEPRRAAIAALRLMAYETQPNKPTEGAVEALARDAQTVRRAEVTLWQRGVMRPESGQFGGGEREQARYQRQLMAEARRLAQNATPEEIQAKARQLGAQRYQSNALAQKELAVQEPALAAIEAQQAKLKATIEEDRKRLAAMHASAEAGAERAAKAIAAEEAQIDRLGKMAKKVADGAAAELQKDLREAAAEAARLKAIGQIEIKLRYLASTPDPLTMTPRTSRAAQVADYKERVKADEEARNQDAKDAARQTSLEARLERGQRVSKRGMEFLEGRWNLANQENLAKEKEDAVRKLEEQRDAIKDDKTAAKLEEIRQMLKANLEAA